MADKLTIRIRVEKIDDTTYQTVSTFAVNEKGQVTIRTTMAEQDCATSSSNGAKARSVRATQRQIHRSTLQPGDDFDTPGLQGLRRTGSSNTRRRSIDALPEDPILIIERAISGGGNATNPIF